MKIKGVERDCLKKTQWDDVMDDMKSCGLSIEDAWF